MDLGKILIVLYTQLCCIVIFLPSILTTKSSLGLNGKTPAEACGIDVKGINKWLTLIQNSANQQ